MDVVEDEKKVSKSQTCKIHNFKVSHSKKRGKMTRLYHQKLKEILSGHFDQDHLFANQKQQSCLVVD